MRTFPPAWLSVLALHAAAQQPTTALVGVVLDADGRPLPRAEVVVSRGEGHGFHCLDLDLRASWRELVRARADRAGRFGVQVPLGHLLRVEVDDPAHARWRRDAVAVGSELTIRLARPCSFRGRLVLAGTKRGATGTLCVRDEHFVDLARARTDDAGNFAFERLPPGKISCDVAPDTAKSPAWFQGTLADGEPLVQDLEVEAGAELHGTVTDARTGLPIAGARVGEGWTLHKSVTTDAKGNYTLTGFGDAGRPEVQCAAPGFARGIDRYRPGEPPQRIDFALQQGVEVTGTVVGVDGRPVAGVYTAVVAVLPTAVPWLPARTGADGGFVCEGLPRVAIGEAMLLVRADGHATAVYALPPANGGVVDVGRLELKAPQVVQGVVRDADGRPVADAVVGLRGTNADCQRLAPLPLQWPTLSFYLGQRLARTDAAGRFAFGDVAPGEYALALGDQADATPPREWITVVAGQDVAAVELRQ